jgi:hypothetical protein
MPDAISAQDGVRNRGVCSSGSADRNFVEGIDIVSGGSGTLNL